MKKLIFLFLLLSSQFAYGEPGIRTGWGDNPDAKVVDAVRVNVHTDTGTDPFTLGSTAADDDYIYVSYHYGEHLVNTSFFVTEVYLQQLGDRMVFVLDEGSFIIQLLPDTEIYYNPGVNTSF